MFRHVIAHMCMPGHHHKGSGCEIVCEDDSKVVQKEVSIPEVRMPCQSWWYSVKLPKLLVQSQDSKFTASVESVCTCVGNFQGAGFTVLVTCRVGPGRFLVK